MKYILIFSGICLAVLLPKLMQDHSLYEKKTFSNGGEMLQYRILYPLGYDSTKRYPVITVLHGSGERGSDNEAQLTHGSKLFLNDTLRKNFPAIVIFPQCPTDSTWNYVGFNRDTTSVTGASFDFSNSLPAPTPTRLVKLVLDSLVKSSIADPARMYIGGLSMGGFGTFGMLQRDPDFFAAAFPICGGGDTTLAGRFSGKVAVWIFHGDKDKSVDVKYSRQYYAALKKSGADVRYTEYPGVEHNSWDYAFAEKELLPWMFSKSKR